MTDPNLRLIDSREFTRGLRVQEHQQRVRDRVIFAALQFAIAASTLVAFYLITSIGPAAKYGYVVGLVSQPLWIAATWRARQFGMFIVAVMMLGLWLRGVGNNFF